MVSIVKWDQGRTIKVVWSHATVLGESGHITSIGSVRVVCVLYWLLTPSISFEKKIALGPIMHRTTSQDVHVTLSQYHTLTRFSRRLIWKRNTFDSWSIQQTIFFTVEWFVREKKNESFVKGEPSLVASWINQFPIILQKFSKVWTMKFVEFRFAYQYIYSIFVWSWTPFRLIYSHLRFCIF